VDDKGTGGGRNNWYSAVGPTLQLAASTPTTAQLFYAKNIIPSTGPHGDPIEVTYLCPYSVGPPVTGNPACTTSPSISLAGVVVVEYSGLDPNYPLDSVSAGYSASANQTSLLDSGTVAPANSNLLLFAGGISDTGTANAGIGFAGIQSHNFSSGMAITEQNSSAITGNNVLQRATACLGPPPLPCPSTPTGNWVMQMAVFRDASWTVSNGFGPIRNGQIHADQFPGVNSAAQADSAAPGGIAEGTVILPPSMPLNGADCTYCTWNQPNVGANFGTVFWDARKGFYLQSSLDAGSSYSNSACCGYVEGVVGQANFVAPLWSKVYSPTQPSRSSESRPCCGCF